MTRQHASKTQTQVVERYISRLATIIALLVALVFPLAFGLIAYRGNVEDLAFKAFVKASALGSLVTTLPSVWEFSENRINGVIAREPVPLVDERVEVFNASNELLTATGIEIPGLALARSAPLYDGARAVGRVVVLRCAHGILKETLLAAIFGLLLGWLVQVVLRKVPLRALRRAADELVHAETRAATALSAITDGVIMSDASGRITYINHSAVEILGHSEDALLGARVSEVIQVMDAQSTLPLEGAHARAIRERQRVECKGRSVLMRADGQSVAVDQYASPLLTEDESLVGAVLSLHDVSQIRRLVEQRTWEASHDPLTGLLNRRAFEQRVGEAIADPQVSCKPHILLYMDLDRFKIVNDACGHGAGDQLLIEITGLIRQRLRDSDVLARLGGDEFGLLLICCDDTHGRAIAEALIESVSTHAFRCQGQSFCVGVSVGMTVIDETGISVERVIADADSACYWAKDQGSNQLHLYRPRDEDLLARRRETSWVGRIQAALREGHFLLYQQRIAPLGGLNAPPSHVEVLLRMRGENGQIIPPGQFLRAAERYDLMPQIDRWVIREVFSALSAANGATDAPPTAININLSGASVNSPGLIGFLREQLEQGRIDPQAIRFEITETVALRHAERAAAIVSECRELGFTLALDDFGVGASSLRYLRDLPVEMLKIDGSFVRHIDRDPIDRAMVESINHIAHLMGKLTVAEYAESPTIIGILREIGVDFAQGYGSPGFQGVERFI